MSTEIIPNDHVEIGTSRFTTELTSKENLIQLATIILEELQECSDALVELADMKDIDTVEGVWLDNLGKVIGEDRNGRNDADYRQALQLRIAINRSDGTPTTIYEIVQTYTGSEKVRIAEGLLSYGQIIITGDTYVDKSLYDLVEDIKPIATRLTIVQNTDGKCFAPSYEWPGGTSDPDSIGAEHWAWETPDNELLLEDGSSFILENGSALILQKGGTVEDDVYLPWEIGSESKYEDK